MASRRRADPRGGRPAGGLAASYSRYSSDLQDDSSIDQQQRKCRDAAAADGHDLRPELEFADHAASGSRPDRQGLLAVLAAARAGRFSALYFESLSRLAREFVISGPILKELVHVYGVRVVSTSEGVDSDRPGWELTATFRSWMHTEFLKQLREAVLRGQEEAVLAGHSVGHWCFGYRSEPVPGSAAARRGRAAKPRMRVVVDDAQAAWVRQIFRWFADDRRPAAWIARELTRQGCPKDHRATKAPWRPAYVVKLLRNPKYVGLWPWGGTTNVLNPITGKVRQEGCRPEDAAAFTREAPELRLVDDDLFARSQGILDENQARLAGCRQPGGTLKGSTRDAQRPRHLLQGLVVCAACGATFKVAGAGGRYLKCDGHSTGACAVKTQLPRERAEWLILERIGTLVLADPAWREAVYAAAAAAWEERQAARPDVAKGLRAKLAVADARIARLVDAIEEGGGGEERERLAVRRRERDDLRRELAAADRPADAAAPPTREWVARQLADLHGVLAAGGPAAAVTLRELVGRVRVAEVSPAGGKRKYLAGSFSVRPPIVLAETGEADPPADAAHPTLVVEFKADPPWAAVADEVKAMIDAGVRFADVAAALGCPRSWPRKALADWHAARGSTAPDGRATRGRLVPKPPAGE